MNIRSELRNLLDFEFEINRLQARLIMASFILVAGMLWSFSAYIFSRETFDWDWSAARHHAGFVLRELRLAIISNPGEPRGNTIPERWATYQQVTPGVDTIPLDPFFFARPFNALFSADIFRRVWLLALVFWIVLRIAAHYLDKVFELNDMADAERFILQSAFASRYNILNIRDGDVAPPDRDSNIVRIGGPGLVRVHLENAALFENYNRFSLLIPPTGGLRGQVVPLRPFEYLRSVIDLRDQVMDLNVEGRTRDGIPIRVENVRVMYSIHRGNRAPTLHEPYPFDRDAFYRLVYRQTKGSWISAIFLRVHGRFRGFFTRHTLGEFLAATGQPEQVQKEQQEISLQKEVVEAGGKPNGSSPPTLGLPDFVPRPEITDLLLEETGGAQTIDLSWVDVGTWVLPQDSISKRHQDAWRIAYENIRQGHPFVLEKLQWESCIMELYRLIQEVPLATFYNTMEQNGNAEQRRKPAEIAFLLLVAYRDKLRDAWEVYQQEGAGDTPDAQRLRKTLEFITRFTVRWLGGPAI